MFLLDARWQCPSPLAVHHLVAASALCALLVAAVQQVSEGDTSVPKPAESESQPNLTVAVATEPLRLSALVRRLSVSKQASLLFPLLHNTRVYSRDWLRWTSGLSGRSEP